MEAFSLTYDGYDPDQEGLREVLTSSGNTTLCRLRFVSMADPDRAGIEWTLTATNWSGRSAYAVAAFTDDYDPVADMQSVLDDLLPAIQQRHHTVRVTGQVIEGYPGPALVDASRDADLLVVGSRGHSEFAEAILGSVGMCAAHAHCPVLVYRCDGDR